MYYSMRRSVNSDLELEPGVYSVLMRITAKRISDDTTVERIVKEKCEGRPNKLIQIGLSYNLAHAKGEIVNHGRKETSPELEESQKGSQREGKATDFQDKAEGLVGSR